jgi:hypothetical protein
MENELGILFLPLNADKHKAELNVHLSRIQKKSWYVSNEAAQ